MPPFQTFPNGFCARWSFLISILFLVAFPMTRADASLRISERSEGFQHSLYLSGGSGFTDHAVGELGYRMRLSQRFRLGLRFKTAYYQTAFIGALPIEDGVKYNVSIPMTIQFAQDGRFRADFLFQPGIRVVQAPGSSDKGTGFFIDINAGVIVHIRLLENLHLQTGVAILYGNELSPTFINDIQGGSIFAGLDWAVSKRLSLFVKLPFGPVGGGDGDTAKFLFEAMFGLRFQLSGSSSSDRFID